MAHNRPTLSIHEEMGANTAAMILENLDDPGLKAGIFNPFYDALFRDMAHIMKTRERMPLKRCFAVKPNSQITFNKAYVDKFYSTEYQEDTTAKTITKQLQMLFHTPQIKAKFAYAKVDPWEHARVASCYTNVGRFCEENPDYEPLYVYTVWDQGLFYELEPHALIQEKNSKRVLDITPTIEVLRGKPSLSKVCYVFHPSLSQMLISAKFWRIQYGFIVEKEKTT